MIRWFVEYFLFSGMAMFAAGQAIDLGGGGGEPAAEPVGEPDAGAEAVEPAGDEPAAEGAEAGEELAEAEAKPDGRTISPDVRTLIAETQKSNPKLAAQLKDMAYAATAFKKEFPGGLKEAQALKQAVGEGGAEALQTLRAEHETLTQELASLDAGYAAGDPQYLDNIIEQSPEGFKKLMPAALGKFAQVDPEGYNRTLGSVVLNTIQQSGMLTELTWMKRVLSGASPDPQEVLQSVTNIEQFIAGIEKMTTARPTDAGIPDTKTKELEDREKKVSDSELNTFNQSFISQFGPWRRGKILAELPNVAGKGKQFSEYAIAVIEKGVVEELAKVLGRVEAGKQSNEYLDNLQRLHAQGKGDVKALLQFAQSRAEKLIPEAVKRVYRQLYTEATLGTPKKPADKPGNGEAGKKDIKAAERKGFVKVAKAPSPDEVDNVAYVPPFKSNFEMKFKHHAILKDGRKVTWD